MIKEKIARVMSTHTFRQSIVTVVSTFSTAGLGAVFYLLLARILGSGEYGLFSISLSILTLCVGVVDFGMAQGLVKFVAENSKTKEYQSFAKIALFTKLAIGIVIWTGLWVFATPISGLLRHPEIAGLLPMVGFGILALTLFAFSIYVFQGLQKFVLWGGLQVGANLFRLILFACLYFIVKISPFWGLLLFVSAPLFGFLLSWLWLPTKIISAPVSPKQQNQFWNFNKWASIFTIVGVLVSRIDILLTARFLSLSETGVYALAATMVSFLPQLSSAFGAVTAPKFASFDDHGHSIKYVKKATLFSLGASVLVGIFMIPIAMFVIKFTGKDFVPALMPFLILLAALFIFISVNPIRDSLLYYYKLPKFFFWANLIHGSILFISCLLLIPRWGIVGTSVSVLLGQMVLASVCVWKYDQLIHI